jgi:hypothetical protein
MGNVRVTSPLRRAINDNTSTPVVFVRSKHISDALAEAVTEATRDYWDHLPALALEAGIDDLEEGDTPRFMSDPIAVPGGFVVWADCHDMPAEAVLLWPETIRKHLEARGYSDVSLTTPRRNEDVYEGRFTCPLVMLTATLPPDEFDGGLSLEFRRVATDWVSADRSPDDSAWLGISVKVEVPLRVRQLPAMVESAHQNSLFLATGTLKESGRSATLWHSQLTLTGFGLWLADGRALDAARELEGLARRLAPHAAQISIDFPECDYNKRNPREGIDAGDVTFIADEVLNDAYPFQIIGPGHIAREPRLRDMVENTGDKRYVLRIGDYEDWMPGSPKLPETLRSGRALLGRCMVTIDQAIHLRQSRTTNSRL